MYIAAIIPPNNAEIPLLGVKQNIFKKSSVLSSWALKPIIPFAYTEEQPKPLRRKDLPELPQGGLSVEFPDVVDQQYVLGSSQCNEFCKKLEVFFSGCAGFRTGLCGLHLFDIRDNGINDIETIKQSVSTALSELEKNVFVWKSCSLGVFRLDSEPFSVDKWWTRVLLSEVFDIRFPRSPKQ